MINPDNYPSVDDVMDRWTAELLREEPDYPTIAELEDLARLKFGEELFVRNYAQLHDEPVEAVTAGIKRWNPDLHPRGKDGRFIEVGGWIRAFIDLFDGDDGSTKGRIGRVKNIVPDPARPGHPKITVEVKDRDGGFIERVVDKDAIADAPDVKATLPSAEKAKARLDVPDTPNAPDTDAPDPQDEWDDGQDLRDVLDGPDFNIEELSDEGLDSLDEAYTGWTDTYGDGDSDINRLGAAIADEQARRASLSKSDGGDGPGGGGPSTPDPQDEWDYGQDLRDVLDDPEFDITQLSDAGLDSLDEAQTGWTDAYGETDDIRPLGDAIAAERARRASVDASPASRLFPEDYDPPSLENGGVPGFYAREKDGQVYPIDVIADPADLDDESKSHVRVTYPGTGTNGLVKRDLFNADTSPQESDTPDEPTPESNTGTSEDYIEVGNSGLPPTFPDLIDGDREERILDLRGKSSDQEGSFDNPYPLDRSGEEGLGAAWFDDEGYPGDATLWDDDGTYLGSIENRDDYWVAMDDDGQIGEFNTKSAAANAVENRALWRANPAAWNDDTNELVDSRGDLQGYVDFDDDESTWVAYDAEGAPLGDARSSDDARKIVQGDGWWSPPTEATNDRTAASDSSAPEVDANTPDEPTPESEDVLPWLIDLDDPSIAEELQITDDNPTGSNNATALAQAVRTIGQVDNINDLDELPEEPAGPEISLRNFIDALDPIGSNNANAHAVTLREALSDDDLDNIYIKDVTPFDSRTGRFTSDKPIYAVGRKRESTNTPSVDSSSVPASTPDSNNDNDAADFIFEAFNEFGYDVDEAETPDGKMSIAELIERLSGGTATDEDRANAAATIERAFDENGVSLADAEVGNNERSGRDLVDSLLGPEVDVKTAESGKSVPEVDDLPDGAVGRALNGEPVSKGTQAYSVKDGFSGEVTGWPNQDKYPGTVYITGPDGKKKARSLRTLEVGEAPSTGSDGPAVNKNKPKAPRPDGVPSEGQTGPARASLAGSTYTDEQAASVSNQVGVRVAQPYIGSDGEDENPWTGTITVDHGGVQGETGPDGKISWRAGGAKGDSNNPIVTAWRVESIDGSWPTGPNGMTKANDIWKRRAQVSDLMEAYYDSDTNSGRFKYRNSRLSLRNGPDGILYAYDYDSHKPIGILWPDGSSKLEPGLPDPNSLPDFDPGPSPAGGGVVASSVPGTALLAAAKEYSKEQRDKMAESGVAMADGSFPIPDVDHVKRAIQAFGRAKPSDRMAVKRHILKRARALGANEDLIARAEELDA